MPENDLVGDIVLRVGTIFRVKPKTFGRATTALVHCSLLEGVAFGESVFQVLSRW